MSKNGPIALAFHTLFVIFMLAPILVVDRPGSTLRALSSRAAQALRRWRRPERDARRFASLAPPALLFLHGPRSGLSSTSLRRLLQAGTRAETG